MIVDSSALIAIVLREPGWEALAEKLSTSPAGTGAPTLAEAGIVLTAKLGPRGRSLLARVVQEARVAVIPFTDEHWPIAIDAYARFGKGRHAAGLNFGDCLTYAAARLANQPLIYVGEDFAKTDLPRA
ncbi:MAG: type II toxin-antitoxin system VapC family toxin [Chloroflexi bacterium]|nr:MAG: type II toxin-antitoxin system VapC family toxin [Chloroflexota bacterium]